ncbi:MAG TPA: hypothetical protein VFJ70_01235 [Burkholderiales bacterium]|nr:hypothetical protein [Burkholderiales bacterium]
MARYGILLPLGLCLLLPACEPVTIALLGGGVTTVLRYNLEGVAARTFTAPAATVKTASLAALQRMGLAVEGTESLEASELIRARSANRDIEIELEPITERLTRMRITARSTSLLYDTATALELVQQTEKSLDAGVTAKTAPAVPTAAGASRLSAN